MNSTLILGVTPDDVHLGTYGLLVLGERFAKVIYDNR